MLWPDCRPTLLTILTFTLCTYRSRADLPLYTSDIPDSERGETIKKLEKSLLGILGMKDKPTKPKHGTKIFQYMVDLYDQQVNDPDYMSLHFNKDNSYHANAARSFGHIGTKTHSEDSNIVNLYFNLSDSIAAHEDITLAELHLFPHNYSSHQNTKYKIDIYELVSSPHSVEKAITRLIDTRIVTPATHTDWQLLDITPAAQRWHSHHTRRLSGVQVHIQKYNGQKTRTNHLRLRRDLSQTDSEWQQTKPHVVIFSHDSNLRSRTKRGSGRRRNRGMKRVKADCQRREMTVNFADVGWEDWILAPKKFDAYHCQGACPFPLNNHLNATNHAIIQTLVSEVDSKAVPQACCVPTDLSPIAMLYVGDSGQAVSLKNYPDMVVEACGCR